MSKTNGAGVYERMKGTKTKLIKTSICECGFNVLLDDIKLGTEFTVYPSTVRPTGRWTLRCGGCNKITPGLGTIHALSVTKPWMPPMMIPLELFEISSNYTEDKNE